MRIILQIWPTDGVRGNTCIEMLLPEGADSKIRVKTYDLKISGWYLRKIMTSTIPVLGRSMGDCLINRKITWLHYKILFNDHITTACLDCFSFQLTKINRTYICKKFKTFLSPVAHMPSLHSSISSSVMVLNNIKKKV